MFRKRFAVLRFSLCAAGSLLSAPVLAGESAAAAITAFHATLTDSMSRSAKLGCEGRLKLVQPAVDRAFDLPFVAERALRRHWKTLTPAQRETFTTALRRSVVTTYATEFASPAAVTFATGSSEAMSNGDALVHSTLTPKGGQAITLDYVLKPRGEHWQVVNVLADGVSDLALRATQYDGLMKSQGFEALIGKLETQTGQLMARCQ